MKRLGIEVAEFLLVQGPTPGRAFIGRAVISADGSEVLAIGQGPANLGRNFGGEFGRPVGHASAP